MRAVICRDNTGLDGLELREVPDPVAGPGQVVIDIHAASVEFVDTLIATGRYQIKVPTPFTPGNNCAGVVTEVGDGVDGFSVGDRVHGATRDGDRLVVFHLQADSLGELRQRIESARRGVSVEVS